MQFFSSAIDTLQTLVVALGAGLGVWGVVNLLEGYGSDNPGSKSQGMKQLMAGGGIILLGPTLILSLIHISSTIKEISENWLGKATISMQTDSRSRGSRKATVKITSGWAGS